MLRKPELIAQLGNCATLPTPPTIALRVLELAKSPECHLDEVAQTLSFDPALASKVLRVANSALYRRRSEANTLKRAIATIGLNGTITLALGFSLTNRLHEQKYEHFDLNNYWRRSVIAAVAASTLGAHLELTCREELFLGGLLKDIGIIAIVHVFPEIYKGASIYSLDRNDLVELERSALDADHTTAGAWLLKHWGLPDYLVQLVACSHDPKIIELPSELETMAKCVTVSGYIADYFLATGGDLDPKAECAENAAAHWLGINGSHYQSVLERIAASLPDVASLFEISELDSATASEIVNHSKEILVMRNLQALAELEETKSNAETITSDNRILRAQATTDHLTGLINRRRFDEMIEADFARSTAKRIPLSIAFLDVDHFKQVNDSLGHQGGDQVLRLIAETLTDCVRERGYVARYGGEEFLVAMPGLGASMAEEVAERMLGEFRSREFVINGKEAIKITCSIGIACHMDGFQYTSTAALLRDSDRALYQSKNGGRNRIVICPGPEGPSGPMTGAHA